MQVAFIGGVADSSGYGWAIAKQLANAGATIIVGTWPPVLTLFERGIKKGFGEDSKLIDGSDMKIAKVAACLRQRTSGGQTLPACRAATRAWIYVVGRCGGGLLDTVHAHRFTPSTPCSPTRPRSRTTSRSEPPSHPTP
jgi:NAD(P)-dependent dehydrogenase (short-subunit alcohol dehydrogenase family)